MIVTVEGQQFKVEFSKDSHRQGTVNNNPFILNINPVNARIFKVEFQGKSHIMEVMGRSEHNAKELAIKLNGKRTKVLVEDKFDAMLKSMGFDFSAPKKVSELKAPMPGKVIDVLVEVGQTIEKGAPLLILEAMKMENIIKATGAGLVKEIKTAPASTVDKGQVLIKFE